MSKKALFIACTVGLILSLGCDSSPQERLAIRGTVYMQGKPLHRGSILLLPTRGVRGPSSGGTIADGEFDIPASAGPGRGSYVATISAIMPASSNKPQKNELARRFPETTTVRLNVEFSDDVSDIRWEF